MSEGRDEPSDSSERTASASGEQRPEADRSIERESWYDEIEWGRQVVFPAVTVVCLLVALIAFNKILLPFVFACALVYLMEPIVVRLSRTPEEPRGLPRWITVILVYLAFFGVVTGAGALIMPRLVGEVVRFAETAPENIREFRSERLPGLNDQIQGYLGMIQSTEGARGDVDAAVAAVGEARQLATARAAAFGAARFHVHRASDQETKWVYTPRGSRRRERRPRTSSDRATARLESNAETGLWRRAEARAAPAFRIERGDGGGMNVFVEDSGVHVARVGKDRWRVQTGSAAENGTEEPALNLRKEFDLEERLNTAIEEAVTFSTEQIASLIEFVQHLVIGILEAFVAIILTLMVAAFISIDLPRFMGFFRSLVPEQLRSDYDEMLARVDRGLAGVIRGQLIICVINGIFTYVGLAIFDVKFGVLLAVIAGILSIIPVFGAVISTIPICLVALTQSLTTALLILGWILMIHFVEGNILNPKIIGTSAEIHPVIVIFALLAGESTYGLVGAILGVPVASIVLSLFKFFRDKLWESESASAVAGEGE